MTARGLVLVGDVRARLAELPEEVLDPFFGAGTVGLVAEPRRRDWLGIELNPRFAELATRRTEVARPEATADQHKSRKEVSYGTTTREQGRG